MQTEKYNLSELIVKHRSLEHNYRQLCVANQNHTDDAAELRRDNAQLNQALTELAQMQSELLIAAKNAALGALVAGVSHELSTPVGNSLMAASTIQHQADEFRLKSTRGISRADLADFIQAVHVGTEMLMRNLRRAAALVAEFKEITGDRSDLRLCTFDLHDSVETIVAATLVRQTRHQVVNSIPRYITLTSYLSAVSDVLSELVSNALCHGFNEHDMGTINIGGCVKDSGVVELTVSDDGQGIRPEHIERIFDPFFTTTLGQGSSGLGLHSVYNLVQFSLRGKVQVSSERMRGTCFTVTIPVSLDD